MQFPWDQLYAIYAHHTANNNGEYPDQFFLDPLAWLILQTPFPSLCQQMDPKAPLMVTFLKFEELQTRTLLKLKKFIKSL